MSRKRVCHPKKFTPIHISIHSTLKIGYSTHSFSLNHMNSRFLKTFTSYEMRQVHSRHLNEMLICQIPCKKKDSKNYT